MEGRGEERHDAAARGAARQDGALRGREGQGADRRDAGDESETAQMEAKEPLSDESLDGIGRVALAVLALVSVAALAALLLGGRLAEWTLAAVCALFPAALMVLGARRRGRTSRGAVATAVALALVLGASFLALFGLRGAGASGPEIAGVPWAVAILLGGVWLVPLLFVGLAYAITFDQHGIRDEDLERLRREVTERDGELEEAD